MINAPNPFYNVFVELLFESRPINKLSRDFFLQKYRARLNSLRNVSTRIFQYNAK